MGETRVRRTYSPEIEFEAMRVADLGGITDADERLGVPRETVGTVVQAQATA
ncbi:MAG: hypothetical protein ACK54X_22780 [Burkholderiales bacterium]|jgi:predicted DNA-binding protein (UPF0251 family)